MKRYELDDGSILFSNQQKKEKKRVDNILEIIFCPYYVEQSFEVILFLKKKKKKIFNFKRMKIYFSRIYHESHLFRSFFESIENDKLKSPFKFPADFKLALLIRLKINNDLHTRWNERLLLFPSILNSNTNSKLLGKCINSAPPFPLFYLTSRSNRRPICILSV